MDLRGINLANSVDGNKIHPKLSNIKWITMFYPDNPEEEISNINKILNDYDKPFTAILGGAKVYDKIKVIEKFIKSRAKL